MRRHRPIELPLRPAPREEKLYHASVHPAFCITVSAVATSSGCGIPEEYVIVDGVHASTFTLTFHFCAEHALYE